MATFRIKTQMGETHTFTSRSYQSARREVCLKPGDRIVGITTIKVEKTEIVGHSMVKEMCEKNEMIQERLDEVEASYIRYWNHRREFWMAKTEKELDQMFPLDSKGFHSSYYYKSEYYQLKSSGWFSTHVDVVRRFREKLAKEAKIARETSLGNLVNAIVKIAQGGPVETFEILSVSRGKAGLEGVVVVNGIVKNLYAIYAEGPIQRLHIRYLIK
jgi:hypothetical protein